MFEINCPYCDEVCISDVSDTIEETNGSWECGNGHQFYVELEGNKPDIRDLYKKIVFLESALVSKGDIHYIEEIERLKKEYDKAFETNKRINAENLVLLRERDEFLEKIAILELKLNDG